LCPLLKLCSRGFFAKSPRRFPVPWSTTINETADAANVSKTADTAILKQVTLTLLHQA